MAASAGILGSAGLYLSGRMSKPAAVVEPFLQDAEALVQVPRVGVVEVRLAEALREVDDRLAAGPALEVGDRRRDGVLGLKLDHLLLEIGFEQVGPPQEGGVLRLLVAEHDQDAALDPLDLARNLRKRPEDAARGSSVFADSKRYGRPARNSCLRGRVRHPVDRSPSPGCPQAAGA